MKKITLGILCIVVLSCAGWIGGGWIADTRVSTLVVDKSIYATLGTAGQAICIAADKRIGVCGAVTAGTGACVCTAF